MSIDLEKDGRIAVITINRPEAMNSLDSQHFQELGNRLLLPCMDMCLAAVWR
jgi:enoyl-CoA hydratase/carnithine racemase